MQSNDAIEVVAPRGGGISEITSFADVPAYLAGTAAVFAEPTHIFGGAIEIKSKVDVGTAVRLMLLPVSPADGSVDLSNSIATL